MGNLLTKRDRKGQTITYSYDNVDRLATKTYPDSTAVTYTYDNDSRLTQAADATGTYAFSYDNLGRLTGTTTNCSFLTSRTLTTSCSYDAPSRRTQLTRANGVNSNYSYDALSRPLSVVHQASKLMGGPISGPVRRHRRPGLTQARPVLWISRVVVAF